MDNSRARKYAVGAFAAAAAAALVIGSTAAASAATPESLTTSAAQPQANGPPLAAVRSR